MTDTNIRNVHAHISYQLDDCWVDISDAVKTVKINEIACSGGTLKMGEFCKNSIEFEYYPSLLEDQLIAWNNKKIRVGLQYDLIYPSSETFPNPSLILNTPKSIGYFYIDYTDVETSNNGITYKVTGYDTPKLLSETFDTSSSGTNVKTILVNIAKTCGIDYANYDALTLKEIDSVPEGTTNAGLLAYLAGYDGYNVRMNADGKVEFYWYYSNDGLSQTFVIGRDVQYQGEFTNNENVPSLTALVSGKGTDESEQSDNPVYKSGSGTALTFQNPYMTQTQLDKILQRVKGFKYSTGALKWRGDQTVRAGDLVRVETKTGEYVYFPVMENILSFDGGMSASITSYTYVTENTVMGKSPTEKKLNALYNGLTEVFQKQTGIINLNLKAGYFRLLQDEKTKYPYGFVIADSETITDTTTGWMWTQGGLMHSSDGFKTADKIAFTEDGHLAAEMISANTIDISKLTSEVIDRMDAPISYADERVNALEKQVSTSITNTQDSILQKVSESYYTKDNADDLIAQMNTQFEQTSKSFEFKFSEFQNQINDTNNNVSKNYNELIKYIRFDNGNIILGAVDNSLTLELSNNKISFKQDDKEVAYITNNQLYITDAVFLNKVYIGNWGFVPQTSGNLTFKKIK